MPTYTYKQTMMDWLQRHPFIGVPVNLVAMLLGYIVSWRWLVDFVRWLIAVGGTIAESAFLLATVYVTTNTVAHLLVTWILPAHTITTLNQISVIAFGVLPELIIASALKATFDHGKTAIKTKRKDAWIWTGAYAIPTAVFLVMTIITITSFVNLEATGNATVQQATGIMLVIRCLAGWSYGMVQILFVAIGKPGYTEALDELNEQLCIQRDIVAHRESSISTLQRDLVRLQEQSSQQEQELFKTRMTLATSKSTRVNSPQKNAKSPVGIVSIRQKKSRQDGGVYSEQNDQPIDGDLVGSDACSDSTGTRHESLIVTAENTNQNTFKNRFPDTQKLDGRVLSNSIGGEQSADADEARSGVPSDDSVGSTVFKNEAEQDGLVDADEASGGRSIISRAHKTVHKNKADGSEAAKKIRRILRRNPNTGPTELAQKAGVSRSYASLIKSQFLSSLNSEQTA